MPIFNPDQEYIITEKTIPIKQFHTYKTYYITRPPYQRKAVWSKKKQQKLLDSIFRRYYIPKLVIREVNTGTKKVQEIIDGQQRITAIQNFFDNKLKLPDSLEDIDINLSGKTFDQLSMEVAMFIESELQVSADVIKNIENPRDPQHQKIATEIFRRLQEGESLNFMEVAHAKLNSTVRNFVVKYSDDITFDWENYLPVDENKNKHSFFKIINRKNDRMQHLQLLSRFLLIEQAKGYVELTDKAINELFDNHIKPSGIGDHSFENTSTAKNCLANLNLLTQIFKRDRMIGKNGVVKELRREYFIISFYLLVRHLRKNYVINPEVQVLILDFMIHFYSRWSKLKTDDNDIMIFSNNRQQSINNLVERDIILRHLFFQYLTDCDVALTLKDSQRSFNENQRIAIYRRDNGLCQMCLKEGKEEIEAQVSWTNYDADHILPHSMGGTTKLDNAQVLCVNHNRSKGNRII